MYHSLSHDLTLLSVLLEGQVGQPELKICAHFVPRALEVRSDDFAHGRDDVLSAAAKPRFVLTLRPLNLVPSHQNLQPSNRIPAVSALWRDLRSKQTQPIGSSLPHMAVAGEDIVLQHLLDPEPILPL